MSTGVTGTSGCQPRVAAITLLRGRGAASPELQSPFGVPGGVFTYSFALASFIKHRWDREPASHPYYSCLPNPFTSPLSSPFSHYLSGHQPIDLNAPFFQTEALQILRVAL